MENLRYPLWGIPWRLGIRSGLQFIIIKLGVVHRETTQRQGYLLINSVLIRSQLVPRVIVVVVCWLLQHFAITL